MTAIIQRFINLQPVLTLKITELQPFGAEVIDLQLAGASKQQLFKLIELVSTHALVLIKGQNDLSVSEFSEINRTWGIHNSPRIWCTHPESEIINRVTNRLVNQSKKGLFAEGALQWHTNGQLLESPEEVVCLWCLLPGQNSITSFLNCSMAFDELSLAEKIMLRGKATLLTNRLEETFLQTPVYVETDPEIIADINLHRRRTQFGPREFDSLHDSATDREDVFEVEKPLVCKNRLSGKEALYFPITSIKGFVKSEGRDKDRQLFDFLYNHLFKTDKYVYNHHWRRGDILLIDQRLSLHKRNEHTGERELLRTAFWYR